MSKVLPRRLRLAGHADSRVTPRAVALSHHHAVRGRMPLLVCEMRSRCWFPCTLLHKRVSRDTRNSADARLSPELRTGATAWSRPLASPACAISGPLKVRRRPPDRSLSFSAFSAFRALSGTFVLSDLTRPLSRRSQTTKNRLQKVESRKQKADIRYRQRGCLSACLPRTFVQIARTGDSSSRPTAM